MDEHEYNHELCLEKHGNITKKFISICTRQDKLEGDMSGLKNLIITTLIAATSSLIGIIIMLILRVEGHG